ncbi:MAG: hypothetical protein ACRDAX_08890 [Propionibacteriaceae bacterium]
MQQWTYDSTFPKGFRKFPVHCDENQIIWKNKTIPLDSIISASVSATSYTQYGINTGSIWRVDLVDCTNKKHKLHWNISSLSHSEKKNHCRELYAVLIDLLHGRVGPRIGQAAAAQGNQFYNLTFSTEGIAAVTGILSKKTVYIPWSSYVDYRIGTHNLVELLWVGAAGTIQNTAVDILDKPNLVFIGNVIDAMRIKFNGAAPLTV